MRLTIAALAVLLATPAAAATAVTHYITGEVTAAEMDETACLSELSKIGTADADQTIEYMECSHDDIVMTTVIWSDGRWSAHLGTKATCEEERLDRQHTQYSTHDRRFAIEVLCGLKIPTPVELPLVPEDGLIPISAASPEQAQAMKLWCKANKK